MNRKFISGIAAIGVVGVIGALLAPGAMAQGPSYRMWTDVNDIRHDMRVVRGEDHRIAADRAALRRDYYLGNHYAARRDRAALHHDLAVRGNARWHASAHQADLHHHWLSAPG